MTDCYPDGTDWSCKFTAEELTEIRADSAKLANLELAEIYAWNLLSSLTAYQVAVCAVSVRPCAVRCAPDTGRLGFPVGGGHTGALGFGSGPFNPHITGGSWVNSCGCRTSDCSCTQLSEIRLPGPVGGIVYVKQDGVALPPTSYRVDNGNRLVRLDGEEWPACQDQAAGEDEEGSLVVRYWRGAAPNRMTRRAAGLLASEFYDACDGNTCRLPDNVVSASMQGTDYEFEPTDFSEGLTGIKGVDAVIRIYNPYKRKMATKIASPDAPITRTPTWAR